MRLRALYVAGHMRHDIWCRDIILSHIDLQVAISMSSLFAIILLTISAFFCTIKILYALVHIT